MAADEREVSEQCFKEATECTSKSSSNDPLVTIRVTNSTNRGNVTQQCLNKCDPKAIFAAPISGTAGTATVGTAAGTAAGTTAAAASVGGLAAGTVAAAVAAVGAAVAVTTDSSGSSGSGGTGSH